MSAVTSTLTLKRRILLKRSTTQINDPVVVQQKFTAKKPVKKPVKKTVKFNMDQNTTRYFYKSHPSTQVTQDPPYLEHCADDFDLIQPNWPKRNPMFFNKTNESKIRIENIQLVDGDFDHMLNNQCIIDGRCRAFNFSFEKSVHVRYTFDLWSTYQEVEAKFFESIPSTQNTWDRFHFEIPIDFSTCTQTIYMALRYTVNDQEYWDNNQGKNYEIILKPNENMNKSVSSDSTKKGDTIKVLGRRYDFTASLSAASRKPYSLSPPPSPPSTPSTPEDETSIYTQPLFYHDPTQTTAVLSATDAITTDSSFFLPLHTYTKEPHTTIQPINTKTKPKKKNTKKTISPNTIPTTPSSPINIISPTDNIPINDISTDGFQMSYADFVNKYCFYNPHPSTPIYNTFSTSPSTVLS